SVLIVEDNPDASALLQFLLEDEGLEVLIAENGTEALFLLTQFRPDLILTDLAMPQMNGLELIKRVKQQAESSEIPIVVLTAYRGNYLDAALSAGATAVLRKPD